MNWRGWPLVSYRTIIELISETTTTKGLTIHAKQDLNRNEVGTKVSDAALNAVPLMRHESFTVAGAASLPSQTFGQP
jgi:hypothetical protein